MDFIIQGFFQSIRLIASMDEETMNVVLTTLRLTGLSMLIILGAGLPMGFALGYFEFPGKHLLRTITDTLLALPTVVIGLLVYAFVSRRGPLGELELLFTIRGMAIGQVILGLPIVISYTATAIEGLDNRLRLTLQTLGASGGKLALTSLWEGRFQILVAALTSYGRIIGEVGSAMMLGGNIAGRTNTLSLEIFNCVSRGDFDEATKLCAILAGVSLVIYLSLELLQSRTR